MSRYRSKLSLLIIAVPAVLLPVVWYLTWIDTPREYLEERYKTVEAVEWSISPFRCFRDKHRMTYNFSATRTNGDRVSGYVCYSKMDVLGLAPPVIHEDK